MSWAFAWRTLIAAELVFGVSSSSGGLGWFIYERKNELDTAAVFAGLLDEFVESGQVVVTTFHQSYSYEDFVEGLRVRCPAVFGRAGRLQAAV